MNRWLFAIALLWIAVPLAGCAGGHTLDDLRRRASFDFNCPEAQIDVYELGGGTRGVRGCGHQATYIQNCTQRAYGACTGGDWIMNTSGGEAR